MNQRNRLAVGRAGALDMAAGMVVRITAATRAATLSADHHADRPDAMRRLGADVEEECRGAFLRGGDRHAHRALLVEPHRAGAQCAEPLVHLTETLDALRD